MLENSFLNPVTEKTFVRYGTILVVVFAEFLILPHPVLTDTPLLIKATVYTEVLKSYLEAASRFR